MTLLSPEKKKRQFLKEQEETWREINKAIWLKSGVENTKKVQAFAKGRKTRNTIWSLLDEEGREVSSFQKLAQLGKTHLQNLFQAPNETNITEIICTTRYFPQFVNEDTSRTLMEEVSEDELKVVLHSFQKSKSLGPDGWNIEFFLEFYNLLGKDLLSVVEETHREGHMHALFNSTFITLISKADNR